LQRIDIAYGFMGGRRKSGMRGRKVSASDFLGIVSPLATATRAEQLPAHVSLHLASAKVTRYGCITVRDRCAAKRTIVFVHRLIFFSPVGLPGPPGFLFPGTGIRCREPARRVLRCATLANFVYTSTPAFGVFLPVVDRKALIAKQIDFTSR
jgi:hypothetical protein